MPTTVTPVALHWACATPGCEKEGAIELVTVDDDGHQPRCLVCGKAMLRARAPRSDVPRDPPRVR
jgi:hypothetical protein